MNTFLSGLMAAALAASFAIASEVPASAAPVFAPQSEQVRSDVVKVHDSWRSHWRGERRYNNWGRRHWRNRYYYGGDPYYAYRPRYYGGDYYPRYYHRYYGGDYYPRYYRRRPGVSFYLNF